VTIEFYYTESRTAEVYLGKVEGLTAAKTVTVPNLPLASGYIRVQTHSMGAGGQVESSQFSRTYKISETAKTIASCSQPKLTVALRAWKDVANPAPTHDSIVSGGGVEAPNAVTLVGATDLWFTYTVTNTGPVRIHNVLVTDHAAGVQVCTIAEILPGEAKGCVRKHAT
jgi:hypothetical protein